MGFFKDLRRGYRQSKLPAQPSAAGTTAPKPPTTREPIKASTGTPGHYKGRHFTTYVNEVKSLEKAGRQDDAVDLLLHLVDATEDECRSDGLGVAPWYYERLAIIYRKQHRREDEISILERFASQPHAPGASPQKLLDRLEKLKAKGSTAPRRNPATKRTKETTPASPVAAPAPSLPSHSETGHSHPTGRDFLAIDFETACGSRASACSVGYAKFCDGELVETGEALIDPGLRPHEWDAFNTSIHGITPQDVVGAPSFMDVWQVIHERHAGVPLVAHNASFDMSVIRAEFSRAGHLPDQPFQYTCSVALARSAWPEMVSVSLGIVADRLGIEIDHHDAKSDAIGSGLVTVEAMKVLGCSTLEEALSKTNRDWGRVERDLSWNTGQKDLKAADFQPDAAGDFDPEHPLFGRTVVFTGTLQSMERREAFKRLAEVGGVPGNGVTKKTNLLVVGEQELSRLASGASMSSKMEKARTLRTGGQDIELIGEAEFLRRL